MLTLLFVLRLSNKFEKSLKGLNIAHALRIIDQSLEKAAAGLGNPFAFTRCPKGAVTFTVPYL
jgi:hypothetical protein